MPTESIICFSCLDTSRCADIQLKILLPGLKSTKRKKATVAMVTYPAKLFCPPLKISLNLPIGSG